jgi:hypothetical protein
MAVVTPLRRAPLLEDEELAPVNVVRLVQFLGPVSPELALVDPELRERARALMPDVPGIRVRRREIGEPELAVVHVPAWETHRRRLATVSALLAASVASLGLAITLAASVDRTPSSVARPAATVDAAPRTGPLVTDPTPAPTAPSAPVVPGPRFIWAPQRGAVGYRVALYRDGRLIFEQDVKKPTIALASTWTYRGRFEQLTRGPYRWLVWALVRQGDSVRRGRAIVSARYVAS